MCPNMLLIMHCKLPSSAKYGSNVDRVHSRFYHAVIQNMMFLCTIIILFPSLSVCVMSFLKYVKDI